MTAANRIGGIAFLKVDGRQYPLRGSFTVSPSPTERTGIAGQDYVHGYTEIPRVPFIEGDVSTTPEVSLETLQGVKDATVQAELANGKKYVLRNAWIKSAGDINTREGMIHVRFEGLDCQEIN